MSAPHVLVERRNAVMVVTLNRPERRNAMSDELYVRLAGAWAEAQADDDVRVVVVTGAGGAFSSGADLRAMAGEGGNDEWSAAVQADPDVIWRALLRHRVLEKPVVAAVEGAAVAGGTEILQGTDVRIAGRSAFFGLPEVRWGIIPMAGSTVRLRRQIPYARAMELLLTGRFMPAQEAYDVGLVSRVVDDGRALEEALEVADTIAANGPLAVRGILRSVRSTEGLPEADALRIEEAIGIEVMATEDCKEGPRAFAERRAPVFKGR
jgi:enoyl-CoA hydratase